jgi:hypothetical protein
VGIHVFWRPDSQSRPFQLLGPALHDPYHFLGCSPRYPFRDAFIPFGSVCRGFPASAWRLGADCDAIGSRLWRFLRGRWILSAATALLFFTLGNGLGAFSLLPLLEAIQTTFSKNPEMLSMLPMPYANAIALFFPQIFGKYFESWIPGSYPQIIAWDDLFAFAGTLVAMLVAVGWSSCKGWKAEGNRLVFLFFSLMGVFLVLRYISFPPVAIVNMLPVIGRQSPKHAGGITVFCFAAAAALVVDSLRSIWSPRAHLCLGILVTAMASSVLTLMVREGGRATANLELARIPILFTIIVIAVLWIMIGLAARAADTEGAGWALAAMVVAELTIYIPMGAASDDFLWARCGMFCASVPFAILVSRRKYRAAIFSGLVVLGFFACFLVPRSKLPDNVDLTQPPRSVLWLKEHARNDARSWGIQPDLSSISRIQDLGAIGPLAPFAFNDFVKLIADATLYGNYKISCYNLLGAYYWSYPLALYLQNKPIFDAAGLRYLFLNKDYFGPGKRYNDSVLLPPPASLAVVYEDDRVRILESKEAKAKVQFHAAFSVMPSVPAIIERFRSLPLSIFGPPMISADDQQIPIPLPHDYPATVAFLSYRPNSVEVTTNSAVPGLLVLNDIYDRAWHVSIDGGEQTLLRVNAFFRGVYVPTGGTHEILFFYRPIAFVRGVDLSLVVLIFLFVGVIAATRSKDPLRLISDGQIDVGTVRWALAKTYCVVGIALSAAILTLIFLTYFHSA